MKHQLHRFYLFRPLACAALLMVPSLAVAQQERADRPPVIDIHLHSYAGPMPGMSADWAGESEARALPGATSGEENMRAVLAEMDRYNVVLGVISGSEASVRAWRAAAPGRFLGGAFLGPEGLPEHTVEELRALVDEGVVDVFGELGLQYSGISPADPRLDPYWDAVADMGVPVALHTGLGPPGGPHTFAPDFRAELGQPLLFEPVLATRPKLKAYLMHAGWPYIDQTIAMMYVYPDLYADLGVLTWALPRAAFHDALRRLVAAGLEDRLLFGTDQMQWPGAIGLAVESVESVPFLTESQKRAILYDNAAGFLELTDEQISEHHRTRQAGGTGDEEER